MVKGAIKALLIVLCFSVAVVPAALAQGGGTLGVGQGELTVTSPAVPEFGLINLDGTAQDVEGMLEAFTVTDARGTGEGWHLTVQAGRLREWDGGQYVEGGKALDEGSLQMTAPSASAGPGTTSPGPSVAAGPYTIDAGQAVTIASAAPDSGMGSYTFSATELKISVSPSAYARVYRTTIVISVSSGP